MARVTGHVYRVPGPGEKPEEGRSDPIRKAGPAFYMSYRDKRGKQKRRLIGEAWEKKGRPPEGYVTRKMAEDAKEDRVAEERQGAAPEPGQVDGKTFGDVREEWLRYCEVDQDLEDSTLRDYRNTSRGALTEEFGEDTLAAAIGKDCIDAYRTKMLSEGKLSRRTAQKHLVMLKGIFKRGKKLKWVPADPTADVEAIKLKRPASSNYLLPAQIELVASCCDDEKFQAAILVAAYTGLRTGELRALRWRDIDFAAAKIHVRSNMPAGGSEKRPKSSKERSLPLLDEAARPLDALSRRDDFIGPADRVFPSATGEMLGEDAFRDALYDALETAGLDREGFPYGPFTFHDLRHSFGTIAVHLWPLSDVRAYMGHADIDTTMRYVNSMDMSDAAQKGNEGLAKLRAAAEAMPGLVEAPGAAVRPASASR